MQDSQKMILNQESPCNRLKGFSLCIDQGNSSTKIGIFKQDKLIKRIVFEQFTRKEIEMIFGKHAISSCIFSSVAVYDESTVSELRNKVELFIEFSHKTAVPIDNRYATPQTLGKDRLAGVVGAAFLKPDTDILVIDAGSAITYDFIDANGVYWGGNISPGIDLRLRALHEFTGRLPLVEAKAESPLIGNNTQLAILSGVLYGIVFEIDGYVEYLQKEHPLLSVFLTGGSTFYFASKLKSAIFADENLVLIGLNRILQYNNA